LNDVAHNFKVRAALLGRADEDEVEFARLAETLRREGVPIQLVGRGDQLKFGAAAVDVLWPPRVGEATQALSENATARVRFY
jgi:beta-lactamase superfamily II metal-dependent hydrolase